MVSSSKLLWQACRELNLKKSSINNYMQFALISDYIVLVKLFSKSAIGIMESNVELHFTWQNTQYLEHSRAKFVSCAKKHNRQTLKCN